MVGIDLEPGEDIVGADIRDDEQVRAGVAEAIELLGGGMDVLVNNAGIGNGQDTGLPPDDQALAIMDVNLFGAWRVTAAALPELSRARGRVVNVASGLAHVTIPFTVAYCASKRGIVAYSSALRIEYGDLIGVSTVYPGYIRTGIHDAPGSRGLSLEGSVPAEPVRSAAKAIARGCRPGAAHHIATTRRGGIGYFFARHFPGFTERVVATRVRKGIAAGAIDRTHLRSGV